MVAVSQRKGPQLICWLFSCEKLLLRRMRALTFAPKIWGRKGLVT